MRSGIRGFAVSIVGATTIALAGCGPFGGGSDNQEPATAKMEVPQGNAQGSAAAGEAAAASASSPAASGGKPAGGSASSAGVVTDSRSGGAAAGGKPMGEQAAASNQCTDGRDRRVVVVNDTSTTLRNLYGSNVNRTTWEEDVLGSDVLAPGARVNVNWDDGSCMCDFDLKAVFSDDTETVRRGFNVCTESTWRIVE